VANQINSSELVQPNLPPFPLYFCVVVCVNAQLHMQREHVKPEGMESSFSLTCSLPSLTHRNLFFTSKDWIRELYNSIRTSSNYN